MLVSWNWLKDYVPLAMTPAELTDRLMMAGLNHEATERVGDDWQVNLEVTSNRPDCLGHLGVAREIAVLFDLPLSVPPAAVAESALAAPVPAASSLVRVEIACPELCSQYTARVIRGVKIASSPAWLADRLRTIGVASVNNVVDVTNYVLMECGQPLHAFDLAKLRGGLIQVRHARAGEPFMAIDHKQYTLDAGMCVIADAERAVALGGVMGGADTEVSPATTDLLIESAEFAPISIRATARRLSLHSPSSYRFERGLDPAGVEWASRRCCELILKVAGGQLCDGVVRAGAEIAPRQPVVLRLAQLKRVLGIDVPADVVARILAALGNHSLQAGATEISVVPPSWRRDLTREIDLIEEVARVHGYDKIPEDVQVPMAPSHRRDQDRVLDRVRTVLTAAGFDEALTVSVVREEVVKMFSPWSDAEPLVSNTPILRGADRLRMSLVPSLLEARRINEALANPIIELFETAAIYLPRGEQLPREQWTLGIVSGGGFHHVKGAIEALVATICPAARLTASPTQQSLLDADRAVELQLDGRRFALLGELTPAALKSAGLRAATTIAELDLEALAAAAQLVRKFQELSPFPAIERDLNLIMDEAVRWEDLAATVRTTVGGVLERLQYRETYRDAKRDGANRKRILFSLTLRAVERTLTSEEADSLRDQVVAACGQRHGAALLA